MFFPGLNRLQFLLVSCLILAVEVVGFVVLTHIYLGWQSNWRPEFSFERGNAALTLLMFFAVLVVIRVVAAMLRLKDADVSVWFTLAYGFPLVAVAFFDAMTFTLVGPAAVLWLAILWRIGAIAAWLAILLVPSSAASRRRSREGSARVTLAEAVPAGVGSGGLPTHHDARASVLPRALAASGPPSKPFGKRRS